MIVWPTMTALGFVLLNALVIALGASSTARYDFGRNSARHRQGTLAGAAVGASAGRAPAAVAGTAATAAGIAAAGAGSAGTPDAVPAAVAVATRPEPELGSEAPRPAEETTAGRLAVGLAGHLAGKLAGGAEPMVGWWLVFDAAENAAENGADDAAGPEFTGPFPDRTSAEWAAAVSDLEARAVYGVRRAGEGLVRRPSPQELAWLAELSDHLERLPEDWQQLTGDDDELTTLVVELAAALVEAGMTLYDGIGPAGGVCLTPLPDAEGILVSWQPHDRMSLQQAAGPGVDTGVQRTMNAALGAVLDQLGFDVEPFGSTGCQLVHG